MTRGRAWLLLAVVVSIAGSSGLLIALYTLLVFVGYVLVMLIVVRPILTWLSSYVTVPHLPTSLQENVCNGLAGAWGQDCEHAQHDEARVRDPDPCSTLRFGLGDRRTL